MDTSFPRGTPPPFGAAGWLAADALERDRAPSARLHEPEHIMSRTDPMTGREITDVAGHPFLVDGNLTIWFESEQTRRDFVEMPTDHPFRLVDDPHGEGYDEG